MTAGAKISLLACVCALILASCGSNKDATIPPANSAQLLTLLAAVEKNAAGGDCELAQQQADEFKSQVDLLPAEVDDQVKQGLFDVAENLIDLTQDPSECQSTTGASGFGDAQPTEPSVEPAVTEETPAPTESETTAPAPADDGAPAAADQPAPSDGGSTGTADGGSTGGGTSPSGGIGQKGASQ